MIIWLLVLIVSGSAVAMDSMEKLRDAIDRVDCKQVVDVLQSGVNPNIIDLGGSCVIQKAMLKALSLRSIEQNESWKTKINERMNMVDSLIEFGADYTLQKGEAQRTIFHTLAMHLSAMDSNEKVLYALDRLLQGICRIELSKITSHDIRDVQATLVKKVITVYSCRNAARESVFDMAKNRKCMEFCNENRIMSAWDVALHDLKKVASVESVP